MNDMQRDTLVFLGTTSDLGSEKVFPALDAVVRRGQLNVSVIGVANSG